MKYAEEIMEILDGFDLTGSLRDAAELAGCLPNTVAGYVAVVGQGLCGGWGCRPSPTRRPDSRGGDRRW